MVSPAEQGNANAQLFLGYMYAGEGVPKTMPRQRDGLVWLPSRDLQGAAMVAAFPKTIQSHGRRAGTGRGVPQNDTKAARWFRMAAEQGLALGQTSLGYMYLTGRGVPKDVVEAVRLFRLAAEQGDATAQLKLGGMYALGLGVPKDDVQAYAWMNIGAAQTGDEKSGKVLEAIAEEMTASAITKAQSLSREYWEAYGPNRASSE